MPDAAPSPAASRFTLSRGGALRAVGGLGAAAGLGWRAGAAAASDIPAACTITPSLTEGPFFVDERLNRSNLTSGTSRPGVVEGVPLALTFALSTVVGGACSPLAGAHVDLWQTDATGVYSDSHEENTVGETFLRGYQITDGNGLVAFRTIYPGWYHGRAVHLHFKVRTFSLSGSTAHEFTSQLYLDDAVSDAVLGRAPYDGHGRRDTLNANDPLYRSALLMPVQRASAGYAASFHLGLRMS